MNDKFGKVVYELDLDQIDTILGYGTASEGVRYLEALFKKAKGKTAELKRESRCIIVELKPLDDVDIFNLKCYLHENHILWEERTQQITGIEQRMTIK